MEEKIIVKSKHYNPLIPSACVFGVGFIASLIWWISIALSRIGEYNRYFELSSHSGFGHYWYWCPKCNNISLLEYIFDGYGSHKSIDDYSFIPFAVFTVVAIIVYLGMMSYSLTVTDKRIYGKTWFGKRVDLPVDSISATSSIALFKGVSVATSSGKISFLLIKNSDEVYKELNNLIINRQSEKKESKPIEIIKETQNLSNADELKKYKELLDAGIITQEEFDTKKEQLLGL